MILPGISDEGEYAIVEEHDGENQQPISEREKFHILHSLPTNTQTHVNYLLYTQTTKYLFQLEGREGMIPTTFRDSSSMDVSSPSCLIPTLSRALTVMAATKPSTHNDAPTTQSIVFVLCGTTTLLS